MTKTKKPILEWSGYAENVEIENYRQNYNEQFEAKEHIDFAHAEEMIASDSDYWQQQWEWFTEYLSELMGNNSYWIDNGSRMGWMNRSGQKLFEASSGKDLISSISPNTDCHYTIWKHYKGFKIRISHHDAPMGEIHIIKPLSEEKYYKLTEAQ